MFSWRAVFKRFSKIRLNVYYKTSRECISCDIACNITLWAYTAVVFEIVLYWYIKRIHRPICQYVDGPRIESRPPQ